MNKLELKDFLKYKYVSNLQYSPNGKALAFILKEADLKNNGYKSFIYLYKDEKLTKLTNGGKEGSFIWKNDDEILFQAARDDEDKKRLKDKEIFTPFYIININGGEAYKSFELPIFANQIKITNDGKLVISSMIDKRYPDLYKTKKEELQKILKEESENIDYEIFDDSPMYFNGAGFVYNKRASLFISDIDGKNLKRITDKLFDLGDFKVDGNTIYFTGEPKKYKSNLVSGIYKYDLNTNKKEEIIKAKEYSIYTLIKLGNFFYAIGSKNDKYGLNQDPDIFKLDEENKKLVFFYKSENSFGNSTGSDSRLGGGRMCKEVGEKVYFLETKRNACILSSIDKNGKVENVINEEGSIDDFDIFNDEITYVKLNATSLQEIYKYSFKKKESVKISNFNDEVLKDKYVAAPEKINIKSRGTDIDGWILYPKDFKKNKKYPAVLDIHGGPKTVYGEIFYHEMQVWANLGYFVFFCNPTGSDGRGDEFSDIRGKYGTIDYENIMDFTDYVLDNYPQIDKNKVAVTGGSYGGFMTNWIVGHTNRFVCAATQRSISNWTSFSGTSDIGPYFTLDQQGCNQYTDIEKLWWHSPVKYAKNVKTPLLFIHSDEDYRCPLEQGLQFYTQIKENGIESRFCLFHGENHGLSRAGKPLHRVKRLEEITNWFEKHVR